MRQPEGSPSRGRGAAVPWEVLPHLQTMSPKALSYSIYVSAMGLMPPLPADEGHRSGSCAQDAAVLSGELVVSVPGR